MNRRLIIGTDIGTDVDDLWTLAMCELCLNEIEKVKSTVLRARVHR